MHISGGTFLACINCNNGSFTGELHVFSRALVGSSLVLAGSFLVFVVSSLVLVGLSLVSFLSSLVLV